MIQFLHHNLTGIVCMYIVGGALAATCSLISTYVVLRKMALISEGVSHAGFGGIAVAMLLGYFFAGLRNEFASHLITGFFCLGTALLIGFFTRSRKVHEDSAIGIFLVATVALGNLLLHYYMNHLPPGEVPKQNFVESLLFGDFAAVTPEDVLLSVGTALACFAIVAVFYWQFLYTTLDEEMARVNGVKTGIVNVLLLIMISSVVVIGVRMVGFLMITAMTILPGATANMMSRRFSSVLALSIGVGIAGTLGAISMAANTTLSEYPAGPIIVLTLFLIFTITWIVRNLHKPKPISSAPAEHVH